MKVPLHMPNLQSPLAGQETISPIWAKYLREIQVAITAELAPGRVQPFWLSAADLADPNNFVQSGSTAGLGVGKYLGWAICNGNNDTPTAGTTFLRWSTAGSDAAGATGGSDSSAHTHTTDINHEHDTFDTDDESAHTHSGSTLVAEIWGDSSNLYNRRVNASAYTANLQHSAPGVAASNASSLGTAIQGSTGAGSAHHHAVNSPELGAWPVTSGAASATDNRPSFKSWVPLMRCG